MLRRGGNEIIVAQTTDILKTLKNDKKEIKDFTKKIKKFN